MIGAWIELMALLVRSQRRASNLSGFEALVVRRDYSTDRIQELLRRMYAADGKLIALPDSMKTCYSQLSEVDLRFEPMSDLDALLGQRSSLTIAIGMLERLLVRVRERRVNLESSD